MRRVVGAGGDAAPAPALEREVEDVVNVPARTNLMRDRFEPGYLDRVDGLVDEMNKQIAAAAEDN